MKRGHDVIGYYVLCVWFVVVFQDVPALAISRSTITDRRMTEASVVVAASSSLNDELAHTLLAASSSSDGRRVCTRILNQWKREILPRVTKEIGFELLRGARTTNDVVFVNDGGTDCDSIADYLSSDCDGGMRHSIVQTLLYIINNDSVTTEAQREISIEIFKTLFRQTFGEAEVGGGGDDTTTEVSAIYSDSSSNSEDQIDKDEAISATRLHLLRHCSVIFQRRMSRRHVTESPIESSEHIRHLLVELLVDLLGYCFNSNDNRYFLFDTIRDDEDDNDNIVRGRISKMMIETTSNICQTIATSTFLDPYPEVLNTSCILVRLLAQLCPLAVRMNAMRLLVPLTGTGRERNDDTRGGSGIHQLSDAAMSKKCLFRHRHSKTRCQAVETSAAIVLCCPRIVDGGNKLVEGEECSHSFANVELVEENEYIATIGQESYSITMEQILYDTVLPGWTNMLKLDSSASVQGTVITSLGTIASKLTWGYSPNKVNTFQIQALSSTLVKSSDSFKYDLSSIVKAQVLVMLLMGTSAGSMTSVQTLAMHQLNSLQHEGTNGHYLPMDKLGSYFQPMLELTLRSCSQDESSCQGKVRYLETLQVLLLLLLAIPLMNRSNEPSLTDDTMPALELSTSTIRSILVVLSTTVLCDDKDMLKVAQMIFRILGGNNIIATEIVMRCFANKGSTVIVDHHLQLDTSVMTAESSPSQMTSMLLALDGLMKGVLHTDETTSILNKLDPTLTTLAPDWFHSSPLMASTISSLLCHPALLANTVTNSMLAWSLLDACDSFTKCTQKLSNELRLSDDDIVCISVSITYLLGCPESYGLSSNVMNIMNSFSVAVGRRDSKNCNEEIPCILDIHFREVLAKILSTAPLPWKLSEPAFRAVDTLLRACVGYTIGSNFDLVAPFFISAMRPDGLQRESLNATTDDLAEEYSLRISLMALLQTILSDESFHQTLCPQQKGLLNVVPTTFSSQFTTDVLLSLVLPNLVWRPGAMASALRKIAVATLFSLLSGTANLFYPDIIARLIPVLLTNLDDSESTTRELSCVCLSMVLQNSSNEISSIVDKSKNRVIDAMYPQFLGLLDDFHHPVRLAACRALKEYIVQTHALAPKSAKSIETITVDLLVHLDDPNQEIKDRIFQVLVVLIKLHCQDDPITLEMLKGQINLSLRSHEDGSYCSLLLEELGKYHLH